MARSLSNVRLVSAYFAKGIAKAVPGRGYATAAKGRSNGRVNMRSVAEEEMTWMPDPKTGFYRPGNLRDEIDAAELRALMLKEKASHTAAPQ